MSENDLSPLTVISDTTPLHYLTLIGEGELLRELYGTILIPAAVLEELSVPQTPHVVRDWIAIMPSWVVVERVETPESLPFPGLGRGEREAITLAKRFHNSILLTDDLQARLAAEEIGIQVVPTIRVIATASALSLVNFEDALTRLQQTNFRVSRKGIDKILARQSVQSTE